jgi:hypothetical protein
MFVVRSPSGYREERETLQISFLQEAPEYGSGSVSNLRIDATSRDRMEQAPDYGADLVEQPERSAGPAAVNCRRQLPLPLTRNLPLPRTPALP